MATRSRMIAYATGTISSPLLYHTISGYLIFFYTTVVKLDVGLISLAYAVSYGVWNAVNDPLLGQLSDRTRSRWGRRIPYIFFGAPVTALLFFLVWSPPLGGRALAAPSNLGVFVYLFATIGLFDLAFSMVNTCYAALFPEMYSDLEERANVSIYRQIGAVIGLLLALGGTPAIVRLISNSYGPFAGWSLTAAGIGIIAWAGFWVSLLGSRESPEFAREKSLSLREALKATLTHKSFLALSPALLSINFIWGWLSTMAAFFNKYVLGASEDKVSILFLAMFGTSILFYPLWRRILLKAGARSALIWSTAVYAVLILPGLFIGSFVQAVCMFAALGAANAGITLVREIVISDVIDEGEAITGLRREGMYFGVVNFVERLSLVLVAGGSALVLKAGRFDAETLSQAPRTIFAFRLGIPALALAALAIFLVSMRFYPLDRKSVKIMTEKLEVLHRKKAMGNDGPRTAEGEQ